MDVKLKNIFQIEGKVIVITGAAGLLGIRHAEAIATFGGTPILLDLSLDKVQSYADELNKRFDVNAIGMSVDITDEQQIKDNVHKLISRYGKIDGLETSLVLSSVHHDQMVSEQYLLHCFLPNPKQVAQFHEQCCHGLHLPQ